MLPGLPAFIDALERIGGFWRSCANIGEDRLQLSTQGAVDRRRDNASYDYIVRMPNVRGDDVGDGRSRDCDVTGATDWIT